MNESRAIDRSGNDSKTERASIRTLIVCKSIHHQNTAGIAKVIAEILNAEVRAPEQTPVNALAEYDLIGFGSGIYFGRFHSALREWIRRLPEDVCRRRRAFLFSTEGLPSLWRIWHWPVRSQLKQKGFKVVDEFHCSGFDTFGPLRLIGGIHRRHPNDRDRESAAQFARRLMSTAAAIDPANSGSSMDRTSAEM